MPRWPHSRVHRRSAPHSPCSVGEVGLNFFIYEMVWDDSVDSSRHWAVFCGSGPHPPIPPGAPQSPHASPWHLTERGHLPFLVGGQDPQRTRTLPGLFLSPPSPCGGPGPQKALREAQQPARAPGFAVRDQAGHVPETVPETAVGLGESSVTCVLGSRATRGRAPGAPGGATCSSSHAASEDKRAGPRRLAQQALSASFRNSAIHLRVPKGAPTTGSAAEPATPATPQLPSPLPSNALPHERAARPRLGCPALTTTGLESSSCVTVTTRDRDTGPERPPGAAVETEMVTPALGLRLPGKPDTFRSLPEGPICSRPECPRTRALCGSPCRPGARCPWPDTGPADRRPSGLLRLTRPRPDPHRARPAPATSWGAAGPA